MLIFRESVESYQNINSAERLIERYIHGTPNKVGLYYIQNANPFSNFRLSVRKSGFYLASMFVIRSLKWK